MQRLPSVSVQQIMQFLTAQEILILARCSVHMLQCAAADFAFQHATLTMQWRPQWSEQITGRLTPFIPIALHWPATPELDSALPDPSVRWQLRELHAESKVDLDDASWASLLSQPCARKLRVLSSHRRSRAGMCVDDQVMRTLIALPHLRSLSIKAEPSDPHIWAPNKAPQGSLACPADRKASLLELFLRGPSLGRMRFAELAASPLLSRLRVLRLTMFFVEGSIPLQLPAIDDAELRGMFRSLSVLEELHVVRAHDVDRLLSRAAESASLRRLFFTAFCRQDSFIVPPAAFMLGLLVRAPSLQCVVSFRGRPSQHWSPSEEAAYLQWIEAVTASQEPQSVRMRLQTRRDPPGVVVKFGGELV